MTTLTTYILTGQSRWPQVPTASASSKNSTASSAVRLFGCLGSVRVSNWLCMLEDAVTKNPGAEGILLGSHGLFTWGKTQRECYLQQH